MESDLPDDRAVLWTYERLMAKTAPYCVWYPTQYCELLGMEIQAGWWMSRLALDDMMRYEWLN